MAIERAHVAIHLKPWGVTDLRPWSDAGDGVARIGELSFERADRTATATSLLLKLLFTSAPLSIQVHPDDAYARSIGLPNGKNEAWYVLDAAPAAKVAVGLEAALTQMQLRDAIVDGSIADLVDWQAVKARDVIAIPAGTIHAIGPGVVIAEIQQRSDATFRLFDHGRARTLHVDDALAVADRTLPDVQPQSRRLTAERTLLVDTDHFILERIVLAPGSKWCLDATRETWLVVLNGIANAGSYDLVRGGAIYAQNERVDIGVGRIAVECLVAYTGTGGPLPLLLQRIAQQGAKDAGPLGTHPAADLQIGARS